MSEDEKMQKMQDLNMGMIIGVVLIAVMSSIAFISTPAELMLKQKTVNYIAITASLFAVSAFWININELSYKIIIKVALYFLCFGIFFLFLFATATALTSYVDKKEVTYKTKIFNASERRSGKSPTNCKFVGYFRNKEKNDWLYSCLSQDEFNNFNKNKSLDIDVKIEENSFGFLLKSVEQSKD